MLLHCIAISFSYAISKIVNQSLHPFQTAFLYKLFILVAVIPYCFWGDWRKNLKTKRLGLHIARGAFSCLGTICFFVAITEIPVSNAAAISYLQHILISLIGFFLFKEILHRGKVVMIVCGLLGALFITQPGLVEFNKYYFYIFLADLFWAMNSTVIKMLGSTERTKSQLFYMLVFSTLFTFPQGIYMWRPIDPSLYLMLIALSLCYLIHYVAYFRAFKYAEMSTVMPFDYARVFFSSLIGVFLVGEHLPDKFTIIGYCLIIAGGIYSIQSEAKRKRQPAQAAEV